MTTITIERALLKQALEALELVTEDYDDSAVGLEIEAIQAIRSTLAAPATAPEPIQLRQGECWPESTMAQWDYYRKLIAEGDTSSAPRDWFESLAEMRLISAPATAPEQPAWHDAPTCAGLWLSEHDNAILTTWRFSAALFERGYWTKPKTRWYGPIPEDKQ